MPARVLIIDDDADACRLIGRALRERGYATSCHTRAEDALGALVAEDFDVVVSDVRMPDLDGVTLCQRVAGNHPGMPVILLTAYGSVEAAIDAIRAGARDFLTKPFEMQDLERALEKAVSERGPEAPVKRLRPSEVPNEPFDELIGSSEAMRRVVDQIRRAAASDSTVLVTGESGTGKELVARALHVHGPRKHGPFVAINCAAMPEKLLESELFGHVRGAFTDATETTTGLFLRAHRGTLFLDEIGAMPLELQPKLLRALQDRTVRPVGGSREIPFDARIVAATNRDLHAAVEEGTFREDLLFRLDVLHIELPPLRARGHDVLELAERFVAELSARSPRKVEGISPAAASQLREYPWPGNVRELRNCMEAAVTLTRHERISLDDLPVSVRSFRPIERVSSVAGAPSPSLAEMERRHIERVLRAVQGNKVAAARVLGISRATLYRKLRRRARPET